MGKIKHPGNLKLKEFSIFKRLTSPGKVQDFIDAIPMNFEKKGETCCSPLMALRHNEAHCLEGALLAASIFWCHNQRPLLLDLVSAENDHDHVVALFRAGGRWGAVSKTNHAMLRYRDPVYKSVRELAMSYFNEYFIDSGEKTMKSYSAPFNLARFGQDWLVSEKNLWEIGAALDDSRHYEILEKGMSKKLRPADAIEVKANKIKQWLR